MPPGIYKRKSPVKSNESLLKYYKKNGIKKKKIKLEYKSGHTRGNYNKQKSRIEDIRNYIKENDITKEEVISAFRR